LNFPPVITRPAEYRGMKVPEVLLGGNHLRLSGGAGTSPLSRHCAGDLNLIEAHQVSADQRLEMEKILTDIDDEETE